jgi:hypothetical protein
MTEKRWNHEEVAIDWHHFSSAFRPPEAGSVIRGGLGTSPAHDVPALRVG